MLLFRKLKLRLLNTFKASKNPKGLILAGVVGCGKTTLIDDILIELKNHYSIFKYSGDDIQFRNAVLKDTKFIYQEVISSTSKRALIFVDEVQKCEEIFDAIKYVFDNAKASFIVSGSNPAYLNSVAKRRLQRRADFWELQPFSLPEILHHQQIITRESLNLFEETIFNSKKSFTTLNSAEVNRELENIIERFFLVGGLPLSHLAPSEKESFIEIQKVIERGFELLSVSNEKLSDIIRIELGHLQSKEFTYKNIMQQTGVRKRDVINKTIDELMNHGYLVRKKPIILEKDKKTYLSVYSYIDPGMVTYLTAETNIEKTKGQRLEGYIHARISNLIHAEPLKIDLFYFKPYERDTNQNLKYLPGEIDFVIKQGNKLIPIETKFTKKTSEINTNILKEFIHKHDCEFGVVLYGGLPFWNKEDLILFFPYWLV